MGPGRLTFQLLRCERVLTPLTWEPATPTVSGPATGIAARPAAPLRALLIEKTHTRQASPRRWRGRSEGCGRGLAELASGAG